MSIIQGSAHTSAGGYQIERSLRFNSADSAYLSRTPASAGNRKTWTWSGWVKRSALGATQFIFGAYDNSSASNSTYTGIGFGSTDTLSVAGWSAAWRTTTQVFRDTSAWYHIVVALDTTQATANNRVKVYVNGVEITAFGTTNNPTQNDDLGINATNQHRLGSINYSSPYYFSGYLTEVNFIDGQALTPSSFGETDTNTGVWKPKAYSGTYGTNGFFLKFADNSGTTSTTLGKDSSGNGNNWTPNNFSVTAGIGNDSLVDTPTSYGTDTGAGGEVRGNYATLNPLALGSSASLANGNLDISYGSTTPITATMATMGMSSGKWYWEATFTASSVSPNQAVIGITNTSVSAEVGGYPGNNATGWGYYGNTGQKFTNGTGSAYGATFTTNDVIGFAFDADAGSITAYKNGVSQGVMFSSLAVGTYFPAIGDGSGAPTFSASFNFGQRPFAYTAPSGFKALCTQNLPTPTIGATSTTQANDYFNAVLYTGNGTAIASGGKVVSGVSFQPDFVWIKSRTQGTTNYTGYHNLYDAVRGANKYLTSSTTEAESTLTQGLASFNSDGFTVGSVSSSNYNGDSFVSWNWKANGAGVTNTAGSITSTVSANTTSGFSIVTYTGNGSAGATIGHGLGIAPSFIIVKNRDSAVNWNCYHISLGATKIIELNSTNAATTTSTRWNDTTPSSTVVTLGSSSAVNSNTVKYVAYCFAEVAGYSKFGSYTGNGSADGPFIYTGFRPAFVMVKDTTSAYNWFIVDNKRNTYNLVNNQLLPNSSGAELQGYLNVDFLSNGFKKIGTDSQTNTNGNVYIYAAFAESPFKYSLAR